MYKERQEQYDEHRCERVWSDGGAVHDHSFSDAQLGPLLHRCSSQFYSDTEIQQTKARLTNSS